MPKSTISVRPATRRDLGQIAHILATSSWDNEVSQHMFQPGTTLAQVNEVVLSTTRHDFIQPGVRYSVAVTLAGEIVGFSGVRVVGAHPLVQAWTGHSVLFARVEDALLGLEAGYTSLIRRSPINKPSFSTMGAEMRRAQAGAALEQPRLHLFNMCVLPGWQGCGVGKVLLQDVLGVARQENLSVSLCATPRGLALYERMGFEVVRVIEVGFYFPLMVWRAKAG